MTTPNIYCFIPCNLDSKRLPNKPLLKKNGKTILEHTYELANQIRCLRESPIILSDSQEILQKALSKEIDTLCTPKLDNGTLRCAWAAQNKGLNDKDIVINVQVDEVKFNPENISEALALFLADKEELGTFCYQKEDHIEYGRDHVKASISCGGDILYFSREDISEDIHVGIYIYTAEILKQYAKMYNFTKKVIQRENLEQMLFYEFGAVFKAYYSQPTFSINTQEDYDEWLQR